METSLSILMVHTCTLPAEKVTIYSDDNTYVEKYSLITPLTIMSRDYTYKENSFKSIYRGTPRLKPAFRTMQLLGSMRRFQDNFFKNGAVQV